MPVVFVSHGSPMTGVQDDDYTRALEAAGRALPKPQAVVAVSAHWEAGPPVRLTGAPRPGLIYDFSGFPEDLYRLTYPAPGQPALAAEIASLLGAAGIESGLDGHRGFDHGVWIPLRRMLPAADVPVVALSLSRDRTPEELLEIGVRLAPLRDRGVLLLGSGGVVHNLRRVNFGEKDAPVDGWARDFDEWIADHLRRRDWGRLARYRDEAPQADLAVPTSEHFDPIFFCGGAAGPDGRVRDLYTGFHHANLSMRSFALD